MNTLFRKLKILRQKELTAQELTEEFYRLPIRSWQNDEGEEVVARYVNGLKYSIEYQLRMYMFGKIEVAYQLALKVEEKL